MTKSLIRRVHRIPVTEEVAAARRFDYGDAFALRLPVPDPLPPRTWLAAGLEDSPAVTTLLTSLLLGVRDQPASAPDDLTDWRVIESTPDVIHIERSLPLLNVVLIGRRLGSSGRQLTTLLTYERPVLSRLLWTVIGVGHRLLVRRLMCHGVTAGTVAPSRPAEPAP